MKPKTLEELQEELRITIAVNKDILARCKQAELTLELLLASGQVSKELMDAAATLAKTSLLNIKSSK